MTKETLKNKIIELKKIFKREQYKFKPKHLITRRIGSFHGFLFLVTLLIAFGAELTNFSIESGSGYFSIVLVVIGMLYLIPIIHLPYLAIRINFFRPTKKNKTKMKEELCKSSLFWLNFTAFFLYVFLLKVYPTSEMFLLLSGGVLLIYLWCYLSNKQHGYTRGLARNETYYYLLDSLEWEVDQLDGQNNISSNLKLDELSSKFTQIIEAQLHERQRDIVGDYLSINDAAFSWIKSIKK